MRPRSGIDASPQRTRTASAGTPSTRSPQRSGCKPRLLWRNDLVLQDGTHVPGVAFVSYTNPFTSTSSPTRNAVADDEPEHPARLGQEEAEAGLCLALEMMRNKPLRISSVITERSPLAPSSRGLSKTQSFQQSLSSQSASQAPPSERQTHYVSSGQVRVYIDPKEHSTVALFQRLFCLDPDLVTDADERRSAKILTISLGVSGQVGDGLFGSAATTAPHSELTIFAQSTEEGSALRLVVGRKVAVSPKRTTLAVSKGLDRTRSFHRQDSMGSQSLHDVFSQAGIRMSQFGPMAAPLKGPRPDDPLPRGSITAMLQARSKRKLNGAESRAEHRSDSPFIKIEPQEEEDVFGLDIKPFAAQQEKRRRLSDQKVAGSPDAFRPSPSPNPTWIKPESEPTPCKTESVTPEPFANCDDVERSNRGAIKKAVHSILVHQYKLTKTHVDYIACYNQTCSGVWCAFRNTASTSKLDKAAVERVARVHLSLYLDSHDSSVA